MVFFEYPTSNIFGVPYLKTLEHKDVQYSGGDILSLKDEDLLVQNGPNNESYTKEQVKNIVLTSVFNNSQNISLTVRTVNLKRVLLKGTNWQNFKSGSYYTVEGLRADSVFITGFIKDTTTSDSKDLETLISTFATGNTIAYKVINSLKGDTSKKTGLIQYKTGSKTTFSIVISQKDVYYAAKFATFSNNTGDFWKAPKCFSGNELNTTKVSNNQYIILKCYLEEIDKGVNISTVFSYDKTKKYGIVDIIEKVNGKKGKIINSDTAYASQADSNIHFNDEYPITNDPQPIGRHTAENFLINVDYNIDYSPSKNEISIHGFENEGGQSTYQNDVYLISGIIKYWPQR